MTGSPAARLPRNVVPVSGRAGAGKSTLAGPLARALELPLIAKDEVKGAIFDALEASPGDLAISRRVGGAAREVLWVLARRCPDVVLEANFRPRSPYERRKLVELEGNPVDVHCRRPPGLRLERYRAGAASQARHRAHSGTSLNRENLSGFDGPIGLGHVLAVDIDVLAEAERAKSVRKTYAEGHPTPGSPA